MKVTAGKGEPTRRVTRFGLGILGLALGGLICGCSDSAGPGDSGSQAGSLFDGQVDPGGGGFVLVRLDVPVAGRPAARVELVGSSLRIDAATEQVSVDVAIRNGSDLALYPPAVILIGCFEPSGVRIVNFDGVSRRPGCRVWMLDYRGHLGDDATLSPGETSGAKTWIFHDPGLVSFAFSAEAIFDVEPTGPRISGTIYEDGNRNGVRDPKEGPFEDGAVAVGLPGGGGVTVRARADGFYAVRVARPGLYTLRFFRDAPCPCDPPECCRLCVTTPDPREVLIVPGPGGDLGSFERADFGVAHGACDDSIPPVLLVDAPERETPQDPYMLLDANLSGDILTLRVGFSGCTPDHRFTLYAGRYFQESFPVQTALVLGHDGLGESCDAYFERSLRFDLDPIRRAHILYYRGPGVVVLNFFDAQGVAHRFRFGP